VITDKGHLLRFIFDSLDMSLVKKLYVDHWVMEVEWAFNTRLSHLPKEIKSLSTVFVANKPRKEFLDRGQTNVPSYGKKKQLAEIDYHIYTSPRFLSKVQYL
jgi:hypothetical protein